VGIDAAQHCGIAAADGVDQHGPHSLPRQRGGQIDADRGRSDAALSAKHHDPARPDYSRRRRRRRTLPHEVPEIVRLIGHKKGNEGKVQGSRFNEARSAVRDGVKHLRFQI
jgi:hypothetical protein